MGMHYQTFAEALREKRSVSVPAPAGEGAVDVTADLISEGLWEITLTDRFDGEELLRVRVDRPDGLGPIPMGQAQSMVASLAEALVEHLFLTHQAKKINERPKTP